MARSRRGRLWYGRIAKLTCGDARPFEARAGHGGTGNRNGRGGRSGAEVHRPGSRKKEEWHDTLECIERSFIPIQP